MNISEFVKKKKKYRRIYIAKTSSQNDKAIKFIRAEKLRINIKNKPKNEYDDKNITEFIALNFANQNSGSFLSNVCRSSLPAFLTLSLFNIIILIYFWIFSYPFNFG